MGINPRTVLVVDPNPGVLVVAKKVLSRADFEVITAGTVDEGLARANRLAPDVLLVDGLMPGASDLAWVLVRRMPLILMAPKGSVDDLRDALGIRRWQMLADVATVLEKPLSTDSLVDAVKRTLLAKRTLGSAKARAAAAEKTQPIERRRIHSAALVDLDPTQVVRTRAPREDMLAEPVLPGKRRSPDPLARMEGARVADVHSFQTVRSGAFAKLLAESSRPSPVQEEDDDAPWTEVHQAAYPGKGHRSPAFATQAPFPGSMAKRADSNADSAAALFTALSELEPSAEVLIEAPEEEEQPATDPPDPAPSLAGEVVLSGLLGTIRVDQILQLAADASGPTCVRFETDTSAIDVFFEQGAVTYGRRHQPADWDALDLWIDERVSDATDTSADKKKSAIVREAELAVFEAVRWTKARFTVTEGEEVPELVRREALRIPLMSLILEGARRYDEWKRIAGELASRSAVPGRLARADEARVLSALPAEHRRILDEIDGQRSIEELVRSVQRPPLDVLKALTKLRDERLVTLINNVGSA
jgi:CheY-like chemotaxis protein